ncbi:hypothetical protein HJFPF1_08094 [Paramyrothecium foliicola]|nr:hypothetical protein HJFPF1_08094 [Paramyrothecium foliicola]
MSPKSSTETASYYYVVPNLKALDPSAREVDLSAHAWVQPTVIDDEDLTFGGKPLSAWYEEERRRLSSGSSDEERRGRERVRRQYDGSSGKHHKKERKVIFQQRLLGRAQGDTSGIWARGGCRMHAGGGGEGGVACGID